MTSKIRALMTMYAMMGMFTPDMYGEDVKRELSPNEIREIERIREANYLKRIKNKGLKEWSIDGITVIALNKKNAIRKINKIKAIYDKD